MSHTPTSWSNADTKTPTSFSPVAHSPALFSPNYGSTQLTYDTLGATYDDPTVTYDQTQKAGVDLTVFAASWSPA